MPDSSQFVLGADLAGQPVAQVLALLDDDAAYQAMARAHNPFGDGKAAERIADIIADAA